MSISTLTSSRGAPTRGCVHATVAALSSLRVYLRKPRLPDLNITDSCGNSLVHLGPRDTALVLTELLLSQIETRLGFVRCVFGLSIDDAWTIHRDIFLTYTDAIVSSDASAARGYLQTIEDRLTRLKSNPAWQEVALAELIRTSGIVEFLKALTGTVPLLLEYPVAVEIRRFDSVRMNYTMSWLRNFRAGRGAGPGPSDGAVSHAERLIDVLFKVGLAQDTWYGNLCLTWGRILAILLQQRAVAAMATFGTVGTPLRFSTPNADHCGSFSFGLRLPSDVSCTRLSGVRQTSGSLKLSWTVMTMLQHRRVILAEDTAARYPIWAHGRNS